MKGVIARLEKYAAASLEEAKKLGAAWPKTAAFERGRAAGYKLAAMMIGEGERIGKTS